MRELGWVKNPPPLSTAVGEISADVNLLRRPLLLVGDEIRFGFNEAEWKELLAGRA
jgi:arsenate reductase-like glutaredoxin family protein